MLQMTDTLEPRLHIDAAGAYTVRFVPCAPFGCTYLIADPPGNMFIPPQAPVDMTIHTSSQLPPETIPSLPPSTLEEVLPTSFTKGDVDRKCRADALTPGDRDWYIPQLVTVEPFLGLRDYADANRATAEIDAVEGLVVKSVVASHDNLLNHHSQDATFNVRLDPAHRSILMNCPDCECDGDPCPVTGPLKPELHTEWETNEYPESFRPGPGDRVSLFGFWVHDCGHAPFATEIHPPVGVAVHRPRAIPIPADRFFPALGGPVGSNVYVPGISTEVWFNRDGDEMTANDDTGLHQPCCTGRGILYACPGGVNRTTLACPDGSIGVPFEIPIETLDGSPGQQRIVTPAPWERVFTFNIYLPRGPRAVLQEAGVTGLPDVPLYVEVLESSGLGPFDSDRAAPSLVEIQRVDEGDFSYLRVRGDLRDLSCCLEGPLSRPPVHLRMAAAWVYPSADNWGFRRWQITVDSMDVYDDGDGLLKGDGEWRLWLGLNNAQAGPASPAGDEHEWTRMIHRDISDGHHEFPPHRTADGGAGDLGPSLLLFPDEIFPDQKIHLIATGYEDDTFTDGSLGMIAERHDQVARAYAVHNVCEGGCASYTLNYRVSVGTGPGPAVLTAEAQSLADAYDTSHFQCPVGDDVCSPLLPLLPLPREAEIWHPREEPLPPGTTSPPILRTDIYEPQEVEERLFTQQSPADIFRLLVNLQQTDPERLARFMTTLREEIDEALVDLGPEVLVDVQGLRASLPRQLWQRYFGSLPRPQSPPGTSTHRLTGAGWVGGDPAPARVEVDLHCSPLGRPNRVVVTWGARHRFDLDLVTAVACDETLAAIRSHQGRGVGRLDGLPEATAEWTLQDRGEPGRTNLVRMEVKNQAGEVGLELDGALARGNLRGHAR